LSEHIIVERRCAVQSIRMNRPEKKNALTRAMYAAMAAALTDGDAVFALSTGTQPLPVDAAGLVRTDTSRAVHLNSLCAAAAEVFALACTDALVHAATLGDAPAYLDLCPSARRS